ncbi:hypothetical protein M0R04_13815 [Candidatus Dojkabacteria bacterium]|jgi:hypothetical protein|nr:hypothetical protein [Candidatus Dojkabacteria bacterium]
MAILKSKSGSSFDTETRIRTNPDGSTTNLSNPNAPINIIPPTTLTGTNVPMTFPPTTTPTGAVGASGYIESNNQSIINEQTKTEEDAKAKLATGENEITNLIRTLGTSGQMQEDAYQAEGVDDAKKQLDEYTSQIEAEQLANRRQIESLQNTNPDGITKGAAQDEINRINRQSLSKQADLAILQSAALRRYDTGKAIADRQVQIQLEPLKAELEAKKFIYDNNKDIFSKAEDRAFQAKLTEDTRNYADQKSKLETIRDLKLNVAQFADEKDKARILNSLSQIDTSSPTALEDALIIAGKYINDPLDRQIKLENLNKARADRKNADKISTLINLDPTSSIYTDQMIDGSKGGRVMTQSEVLPITKGLTVVNQISSLQKTLEGQDTGPILGILRDNNPYDVKAKLINAQLQALIPNLARGVYGEVGVLTNQDIDNYKQTLGNIKTPQDTNNLLLAMTLSTIKSSLDNNFQTMAAAGRDVSGFKGIYSNLKTQLNTLNQNLGVTQISNTANSYLDSALPQETTAPSSPVASWLNTFFYGKK